MRARGGRGPGTAAIDGAVALLLLALGAGLLGLWPQAGEATVAGLPYPAPAWASRLGLTDLTPGSSPNPLADDRLDALGDTPAGARLRQDLCGGAGLDADPAFRRTRAALLGNDPGLCPALGERIQARAPLIVTFGPRLGWPLTFAAVAAAAAAAGWRLARAKRGYDRWRLLGRSTFGPARGAGSG